MDNLSCGGINNASQALMVVAFGVRTAFLVIVAFMVVQTKHRRWLLP